MSYLNGLRLHFAGRFQAAPSTVNNDVTHYNNAAFKRPDYWEYNSPDPNGPANGWWNPGGGAEWRLMGCTVTGAHLAVDSPAAASDAVLGSIVADSDRRPPAKIVDLDPLQQMVSGIWGLEVRICRPDGSLLLRGQYAPASFMDLWARAAGNSISDYAMSGMYQSVLTDLEWGDLTDSPFLQALQKVATDSLLSIKFNVDGYNHDHTSPEFTRGRIVGSIGPATATEPRYFVAGRQFIQQQFGSSPAAGPLVGSCVAWLDEAAGRMLLDMGNALPSDLPGGTLSDLGTVRLLTSSGAPVGEIVGYQAAGWYEQTAGVVVLPADRTLTAEEMQAIQAGPLAFSASLITPENSPTQLPQETPQGLFVRADEFVFRLDAGQTAQVRLLATQYGRPYPGATILLLSDSSQLQNGLDNTEPVPTPPNPTQPGLPDDVMQFPASTQSGPDGWATVSIKAGDPKGYRMYIDGQVYGVRPYLKEMGIPTPNTALGMWNFISFLVWDHFTPTTPVQWYGCLEPIMQQYANLYPIMSRFLDLGDPQAVWNNRELLKMAFSLPAENPNSMPVTRDLSTPKRAAILAWLSADQPLLGEPVTALTAEKAADPQAPTADDTGRAATARMAVAAQRGGKTSALARRVGANQPRA